MRRKREVPLSRLATVRCPRLKVGVLGALEEVDAPHYLAEDVWLVVLVTQGRGVYVVVGLCYVFACPLNTKQNGFQIAHVWGAHDSVFEVRCRSGSIFGERLWYLRLQVIGYLVPFQPSSNNVSVSKGECLVVKRRFKHGVGMDRQSRGWHVITLQDSPSKFVETRC